MVYAERKILMKNKWDERYDRNDYYYGTEPNSFLAAQKNKFLKNSKVLCLAEGEGRNAVFLAKIGCDVTAVDSSQAGLNKLVKLAEKNRVQVKIICCDLNDFIFEENYWDFIISIWCHLPSLLRSKIYGKAVLSLKAGGIIIIEAYTPQQLKFKTGGPQDPDLMPTMALLETELIGLNLTLKQEIERNVGEGVGHQGMSAVVQIIGKKESK